VSFLCRLRQASSELARKRESGPRVHQVEAELATANFMAGELHGLNGEVSLSATETVRLRGADTGSTKN
jgi:hypothetical protein